ncbi:MAG: bacillithiol biosynthesis cysteine-adding enzyme BshC [Rhodothermales bacterium]|nr:bacillithiol biosynthesis cysteine-adding enzyme BshC [Rhodothermales bacterium]
MNPNAPLTLTSRRLPFSTLPGFNRLFTDYCEEFDRVSRYFAVDYRDPVRLQAHCDRVLSIERDRDLLVNVLLEQNEQWGLDEATRLNIESLANQDSVAVVTGQQVGLFGGPLYTIYKTATAVKLAAELSTAGRSVVPVFWLEGEDHDLDEVRSTRIIGSRGLVSIDYDSGPPMPKGNYGPVGRLPLGPSIDDLIGEVESELPPTEFRDEVMDLLRDTYEPGTTFRDAFARFLKALFPSSGLVLISPDHRGFKDAAVPLFVKEVKESADVAERVLRVSEELAKDYHAQVRVRPTNLFYVDDRGRSAIDAESSGDRFSIRDHDGTLTRDELIALIESDPCAISPNVVLRPILQDRLLPTLAYVGGPGEVAYFAQFKPVYDWAGQPMPAVYPRASVTFVEARIQKILARYNLSIPDIGSDLEGLFKQVILDKLDVDLPARFEDAARRIDQSIEEIRPVVVSTDATLAKVLEATRANLHNEWKKLQGKVLKAEKRHHDEDRSRLERLQENLYPGGSLQERGLSVIQFLNKYGLGFTEDLMSAMSTDTREHQAIMVGS